MVPSGQEVVLQAGEPEPGPGDGAIQRFLAYVRGQGWTPVVTADEEDGCIEVETLFNGTLVCVEVWSDGRMDGLFENEEGKYRPIPGTTVEDLFKWLGIP